MNKVIHKADTRGHVNHGWLDSYHTFSFASYYNPERMNFGVLRVLNDDVIKAGLGFGTHPHDNMEIVTIPLSGQLKHQDSMKNKYIIKTGEVQIMSAGLGLTHSEYNNSETEDVALLQIWILPDKKNIQPRYAQKEFNADDFQNKFAIVVSPDEREGSLWINQNCFFSLSKIKKSNSVEYKLKQKNHGVYFFIIDGEVEIAGEKLEKRDGLGIHGSDLILVKAKVDAYVLGIEV